MLDDFFYWDPGPLGDVAAVGEAPHGVVLGAHLDFAELACVKRAISIREALGLIMILISGLLLSKWP